MKPRPEFTELPSGVTLHTLNWEPTHASAGTWLLTHGLASNARLWDGAAHKLAEMGHRVITVDQRGHGLSSKPDDGYSVANCADDLALLIRELDLDQPAVAGQSWGGNVVLELGHRHPDAVSQICCVDGGFIDLQAQFSSWEECREMLAPPRLLGTPLSDVAGWVSRSAADWPEEGRAGTLANFEVRADGTIAPWLTFENHMTVLRGLWEHRPFAVFPKVITPTLLIAAGVEDDPRTQDRRGDVDRAAGLLPNGRAHWFIPAHHDVHAEQPDAVAQLLHAASTEPDFFPETSP